METTVQIDGKDVRFKATAAVPLLYRRKFKRDLLHDMNEVAKAMDGKGLAGENIPVNALTMFECMAYIMAAHADPDMTADSPEEWLEGFSAMSIYAVFPVVQALWDGNMERLEEAKKKLGQLTGSSQQHCSCSGQCSSGCPCETSNC